MQGQLPYVVFILWTLLLWIYICRLWDQLRIAKEWSDHYREQRDKVREEGEAAKAFKAWVHNYLDGKGVPTNPDPEGNKRHGCRISGRMEWVIGRLRKLELERHLLKMQEQEDRQKEELREVGTIIEIDDAGDHS